MGRFEEILESGKSQNEMLKEIADWFILEFGNIHYAAIYIKEEAKYVLVAHGLNDPPVQSEFPLDDSVYGNAINGKLIHIDDVKSKPGADGIFPKSLSTLTIPLLQGDEMKGIIHLGSVFVNAFKQTDLMFFGRCVNKIAGIM